MVQRDIEAAVPPAGPGRFRSISTRIKLAARSITLLMLALALVLGAAFYILNSRTEQGMVLNAGAQASAELTASIAETRYHAARYSVTGEEQEIARALGTLDQAKLRLAETREMATGIDGETADSIDWLQVQAEGFRSELLALEGSVKARGPSRGSDSLAAAIDLSGEQIAGHARNVAARLSELSAQSNAELESSIRSLALFALALVLACLFVAVAGARYFTTRVAGSIKGITRTMTGLAAGNREVEIPGIERQDEIGDMARSLSIFQESARDLAALQAQQLERREREQAERARLLKRLAGRFEHTVGGVVSSVATASDQLRSTASSMASAAEQAANYSDSVAGSMDATSTSVTAAASASDQFALSISEIGRQASNSATLARQARGSAENADSTITALTRSVDEIGKIVQLIHSIAERTNLLALNASIEAARGGDGGRGFAVVAMEVKALADQTRQATREVSSQIEGIQHSTKDSVDVLQAISDQVRQLETNATAIAQAVDEQAVAGRELARNLEIAARGTGEVRTSVGQVRDMAQTTGGAASQVLCSANELHGQAGALRLQVEEFLGYVREG